MYMKAATRRRAGLPLAAALAASLSGVTTGCSTHTYGPALSGYTCCNFHYYHRERSVDTSRRLATRYWISDANWTSLPMIAAGTPIRTKSYFEHAVQVDVDVVYTQEMYLGLDYGRSQKLDDWVRAMIVLKDPKPTIWSWPEPVRQAVSRGKVAIGMTKEQVIVSLGYPPAHETPSLNVDRWKYWYGNFDTFLVVWDSEGRVRDVVASAQVRAAVLP